MSRKDKTVLHTNEVRNKNWQHLYNKDIISMPDKWEFPWVRYLLRFSVYPGNKIVFVLFSIKCSFVL